jgi:hypothetical protein
LTTNDVIESDDDGSNWVLIGGIIGGVLCCLFIINAIVAVVFIRRRQQERADKNPSRTDPVSYLVDSETDTVRAPSTIVRNGEYASSASLQLQIYDSFIHEGEARPVVYDTAMAEQN